VAGQNLIMPESVKTGHDKPYMSGYRRKNRLAADLYRSRQTYFITITIADRKPVFMTDGVVPHHLEILSRISAERAFDVIAYCYMPDHVHLLVAGKDRASDLVALIKAYKQTTGYYYRQLTGGALWQKSFYDHVLRKDEAVHEVARYILANPVRRRMVERPAEYPYSGSLVYGPSIFKM